jgi:DNA replication protein DnaC
VTERVAARCDRCRGNGYLCYPEAAFARARACECLNTCPECGGTGYLSRRDERGYDLYLTCRCQRLERRLARFNEAELPAKFFDRTLYNYEPFSEAQVAAHKAVGKLARSYAPGSRGFLLMGPVGTGKTHLLCAALAELCLEIGVFCRFVDFFHLLQDLREGFSQNRPVADLLDPLVEVPVLAVDELGKGKNTDWELSILDELISKRYNQEKTTLVTTNYTDDPETTLAIAVQDPKVAALRSARQTGLERRVLRETLEERIGPRIHSRLREMCAFYPVLGPDYRTKS